MVKGIQMAETTPAHNKHIQTAGAVLVALLVVASVAPLDLPAARWLANHAPHFTLSLVAFGVIAMSLRLQQVMVASFLGAAALALVLRSSTNDLTPQASEGLAVEQAAQRLEVAQFSTANLALEAPYGLDAVAASKADVLTISGLTPDWNLYLATSLAEAYPYQYVYEDIGLQGIGLFSKQPLGSLDSVHINNVVHLNACLPGRSTAADMRLFVVQTLPPINSSAFSRLRSQLERVAGYVETFSEPTVVLGDFNSVPWSSEISDFQALAKVQDSRRSMQSTFVQGAPQLFEVPVEHIFFTKQLQCVQYTTLRSADGYLGNSATFHNRIKNPSLAAL